MSTTYSLKSEDGVIRENLSGLEIKNLAQAGKINPNDTISKTDNDQWIPAYKVKGIQLTTPKKGAIKNGNNFLRKKQVQDSKTCPYCAETIKKADYYGIRGGCSKQLNINKLTCSSKSLCKSSEKEA
ncbi:MAG: hypothetical protein D3916_07010 [Candidatus Electrothrix sp. MAN1_4]|nr:hypothetical protein [Candidatus Electrothrix sp. MAN1_4]